VKKRLFVLGAATIILVLVMVVSACGQPAATTTSGINPTTTVTVTVKPTATATTTGVQYQEPVKKVLNPAGTYIPVDCVGLAPRLDTLAGKRILFYEAEATNMQLPTLLAKLQKEFPTSQFDVVYTELWGERVPTAEYLKVQACIRGVGW